MIVHDPIVYNILENGNEENVRDIDRTLHHST